jgi:hypothetical protein
MCDVSSSPIGNKVNNSSTFKFLSHFFQSPKILILYTMNHFETQVPQRNLFCLQGNVSLCITIPTSLVSVR